MSPEELAAFVYTGDLYHLRILNESFMKNLITELSRVGNEEPIEDARDKLKRYDEQIVNYVHQVCISDMRGKGKKYEEVEDAIAYRLYRTCENVTAVIEKYRLFFKAFFLTANHPATIATIPNMVRRTVVLSDTDSTMFSTDEWVRWYFGKLLFSDEGYAVGGAVSYIATQSIAHILAHFSANMNVARERLFTLSMKPEYVFPVFAQTGVAKHYYTAMAVKEGSVYKDIKMEIKGVHMKDSTLPVEITASAADEMERIIRNIIANQEVSLVESTQRTMEVERNIYNSIVAGETKFLKRIRIKDRSAYKNVAEGDELDKSNYRHYVLWKEVFAKHYGDIPPPPYQAVSIPLSIKNKTAMINWLNGLENKVFAADFAAWMERNEMQKIGQIHIPIDFCNNHGIPKELIPVLDATRVILSSTRSFRNILESLGLFSKPDLLIMEQH
jgi:hypothetical protein